MLEIDDTYDRWRDWRANMTWLMGHKKPCRENIMLDRNCAHVLSCGRERDCDIPCRRIKPKPCKPRRR